MTNGIVTGREKTFEYQDIVEKKSQRERQTES